MHVNNADLLNLGLAYEAALSATELPRSSMDRRPKHAGATPACANRSAQLDYDPYPCRLLDLKEEDEKEDEEVY